MTDTVQTDSAGHKIVVYIQDELLKKKGSASDKNLSNLTFSRVVGGVANVVYQSEAKINLGPSNPFQWSDDYWISSAQNDPPVKGKTLPHTVYRNIKNGQACDWLNPDGSYASELPAPQSDDDFKNCFGTKNQLPEWQNSIWVKDADKKIRAIYQDSLSYTRQTERKYRMGRTYQLSWEDVNFVEGTYVPEWSSANWVTFDKGQVASYVSWGFASDSSKKPEWFHYGAEDPGSHNPDAAISDSATAALSSLSLDNKTKEWAYVKFDWTGTVSPIPVEISIALIKEFLGINNSRTTNPVVFFNASSPDEHSITFDGHLNRQSRVASSLPGFNDNERIIHYLRGLLAIAPIEYLPTIINFNDYRVHTQDDAQNGAENGAQNGA